MFDVQWNHSLYLFPQRKYPSAILPPSLFKLTFSPRSWSKKGEIEEAMQTAKKQTYLKLWITGTKDEIS